MKYIVWIELKPGHWVRKDCNTPEDVLEYLEETFYMPHIITQEVELD